MSRPLAVLQPSSNNRNLVGGNKTRERAVVTGKKVFRERLPTDENVDSLLRLKNKATTSLVESIVKHRSVSVGSDYRIELVNSACQTDVTTSTKPTVDSVGDTKQQLLSVTPTTSYWKSLAEEREKALKETLKENLSLCQQLGAANERIKQLEYLAAEGQRYAAILKQAIEQPDSDGEDETQPDDDDNNRTLEGE